MGRQIGVFVLHRNGPEELEIKNMAVDEQVQGRGLGSYMLAEVHRIAEAVGYQRIVVGTATVGRQLGFYRKNGFRDFGMRKNFFIENYPYPIFEGEERVCDMILLVKNVQAANNIGHERR
ncbi:GNAT family N-acetyltransferase [Puia sp.]|uniref:GNAT family N-acetyltransferase n=1 Tax=Puia sp. TaxID=2045100 RepID=UPI0039C9FAF8